MSRALLFLAPAALKDVRQVVLALALLGPLAAAAQALDYHGQVRSLLSEPESNPASAANQAAQLQPGLLALPARSAVLEAQLALSQNGINARATVQGQRDGAGHISATGWLNEFYASLGDAAWQWSAGKKVVEWDVGYGFRPNDVVQREKRRTLIGNTPVGRPLAMLEYFDANLAASLVWVNPATGSDPARQQALAARIYYRAGSLDLHGFAYSSAQGGASVGAALAWVAADALELHASARYLRQSSSIEMNSEVPLIQGAAPWRNQIRRDLAQALLGASWTSENQQSLLLEAWWDGTAPGTAQWRQWSARNLALVAAIPAMPQMRPLLAYNLAWQGALMSASENLQRANLFARWSWQSGAWQPGLDLLWTPQDGGRVWTAALAWQGDRVNVNGGLRSYGGPAQAVLAQLPLRRQLYLAATWAF